MKKLSQNHREKVIRSLKNGKGIDNGNWKGGKTITEGYVLVRIPEHPNARSNGYYPEHRLVMEDKLERLLNREEVIHHVNGNKLDNRLENLVLTTHHAHGKHHWDNPEAKIKQSEFMTNVRKRKYWSTSKRVLLLA